MTVDFFSEKLYRISRYVDMLSSSFDVMGEGMQIEPISEIQTHPYSCQWFSSAQYRKIEFASTELINLIDNRFREDIDRNTPFKPCF